MSSGLRRTLVLLCPALVAGCDTTDPDPAPVPTASVSATAMLSLGVGAPVVVDAWLVVDEIRLRPAELCDVEPTDPATGDVVLAGPRAFDLLHGASASALTSVAIAPRDYCGVDVALDTADEIPGATGLRGVSWFLEGRRGDGVPFLLRGGLDHTPSPWDPPVRLQAEGGGLAIDETTHTITLVFDAARLFRGVDLDLGVRGSDGAIHIDVGHNGFLLAPFEANLAAAGTVLVE